MNPIQQDTYGVAIPLTTGADLSGANAVKLILRKPSGRVVETVIDQGAITDPVHGVLTWAPAPGDLDETEVYELQVADLSTGRIFPSAVARFRVVPNLSDLRP